MSGYNRMFRRPPYNDQNIYEITDEEVIAIVGEALPLWKAECTHCETDTVILQQQQFGRTLQEIHLLHAAILYAGIVGKNVLIRP